MYRVVRPTHYASLFFLFFYVALGLTTIRKGFTSL